ncbi:hypothetical protein EI94DRAFT_433158 [Lactarius quietus]|nr:hypothetical protein EI94DRAFT_433158 [Lactarius quietus]
MVSFSSLNYFLYYLPKLPDLLLTCMRHLLRFYHGASRGSSSMAPDCGNLDASRKTLIASYSLYREPVRCVWPGNANREDIIASTNKTNASVISSRFVLLPVFFVFAHTKSPPTDPFAGSPSPSSVSSLFHGFVQRFGLHILRPGSTWENLSQMLCSRVST